MTLYRSKTRTVDAFRYQSGLETMDFKYPYPDWLEGHVVVRGEESDEKEGKGDADNEKVGGSPEMELSFNVGVQFGLTDATSDTALKFQGTISF